MLQALATSFPPRRPTLTEYLQRPITTSLPSAPPTPQLVTLWRRTRVDAYCAFGPVRPIFGRKVAPASSRDILTLGAPNATAGGFVKTAMGGVQGTVATDPRYFPPSPAKVPSIEARGTVAYYARDGTEEDVLRDDEGFIVLRPWTGAVYSASCSSSPGGEGQTVWWPRTGTVCSESCSS